MDNNLHPTATATGKRQITIPIEIWNLKRIKTGDKIIFKKEGDKIIFDVEHEYNTCFACNGNKKVDNKECFICKGTGKIEKSIIDDVYKLVGMISMYSRKYGVSITFLQHEFNKENSEVEIKDFPTIELGSKEYSQNELNRIQDEIQKIIIQQFTPRNIQDEKLFLVPTDYLLNKILDTLSTEKAKEEVSKWFRYEKTWYKK